MEVKPERVICSKYTSDILFCKRPTLPQAIVAYITKQGRGGKVENELSSTTVDMLCNLYNEEFIASLEGTSPAYFTVL